MEFKNAIAAAEAGNVGPLADIMHSQYFEGAHSCSAEQMRALRNKFPAAHEAACAADYEPQPEPTPEAEPAAPIATKPVEASQDKPRRQTAEEIAASWEKAAEAANRRLGLTSAPPAQSWDDLASEVYAVRKNGAA